MNRDATRRVKYEPKVKWPRSGSVTGVVFVKVYRLRNVSISDQVMGRTVGKKGKGPTGPHGMDLFKR